MHTPECTTCCIWKFHFNVQSQAKLAIMSGEGRCGAAAGALHCSSLFHPNRTPVPSLLPQKSDLWQLLPAQILVILSLSNLNVDFYNKTKTSLALPDESLGFQREVCAEQNSWIPAHLCQMFWSISMGLLNNTTYCCLLFFQIKAWLQNQCCWKCWAVPLIAGWNRDICKTVLCLPNPGGTGELPGII